MRRLYLVLTLIGIIFASSVPTESQAETFALQTETTPEEHNWEEYSTHYETVDAGTHEFTYWKNFIEQTRTCDISHKLKSVVYYCDIHDHTDSEIYLEETEHSENHG